VVERQWREWPGNSTRLAARVLNECQMKQKVEWGKKKVEWENKRSNVPNDEINAHPICFSE
jgi:hypothetical protein